jgi:hypothetical protein
MSQLMPYMSDEEIAMELWEYDEQSFSDMPTWLQHELQARSLVFTKREPTKKEMHDTMQDAKEHRKAYNERNVSDIAERYLNQRSK